MMKYRVMEINEKTKTAKTVIVTTDIRAAQAETVARICQGKRAYWLEEEVEG